MTHRTDEDLHDGNSEKKDTGCRRKVLASGLLRWNRFKMKAPSSGLARFVWVVLENRANERSETKQN